MNCECGGFHAGTCRDHASSVITTALCLSVLIIFEAYVLAAWYQCG